MSEKKNPPKQLQHWAASAGLMMVWPHTRDFYGRGCRFRVIGDEAGELLLCLGGVRGTFDRWANSTEVEVALPRNRRAFIARVKRLVACARARSAYADYQAQLCREHYNRHTHLASGDWPAE